jgi:hypothetical protein
MHGLFSIPLNVFLSMVAPPDHASLQHLEQGLDQIAKYYDLSEREARTLKDSLVEPFRQEGMSLGPDTLQWLQILNRRLHLLPPGVVSAGAELQWTTLGLGKYAPSMTLQQYVRSFVSDSSGEEPVVEADKPAAKPARARTSRKKDGTAAPRRGKKKTDGPAGERA